MENLNDEPAPSINPKNGFCCKTNIYYSLRPQVSLPPPTFTLSITDYALSLLGAHPPPPASCALIDAVTGRSIRFDEFEVLVKALASSLRSRIGLSKGDSAFIISPNSLHMPILYFALFSIGVVVSPSNPASTKSEIMRQIELSKPAIAFATSDSAHKVPPLRFETVLLDSPDFESLLDGPIMEMDDVEVRQSDTGAILYSSGTTGTVKGVALTQRNWTAAVALGHAVRQVRKTPAVVLCMVPYFHVYGFVLCLRALAMGDCIVTTAVGKFNLEAMLGVIEKFKVTHVAVAPPIVWAMAENQKAREEYDLSSLEVVQSGGASLSKKVIEKFKQGFRHVQISQAYGLTETTARVFGTVGDRECQVTGATGKIMPHCQAKIVDPDSGIALSPGHPGELWVRGPVVMKGYVGDEKATAATLDSEGWLRTGDLCYIDDEGFLFFVERIKELIKYKGYQVAPAELEFLLHSHPDVSDAAVVPYPDGETGQIPMAFVVRRLGSTIDESQIMDFIAKRVAPYKRIRRVTFVDSLPKTFTGKLLRKALTSKL